MYELWKSDADKRAPYIAYEKVLPTPKRYTDYVDLMAVGSDLYAIKKGHVHTASLVRIDTTGKEWFVSSYANVASAPRWDEAEGRIYWSETVPDARWTLKSDSKIRYMSLRGNKKTLRNNEMLHNPIRHEDRIATVRYQNDGHSSVSMIDSQTGSILGNIPAPDSLQIVETAYLKDILYATAISENGYGIYAFDEVWKEVVAPQPVMIKDFKSYGDELIFACDRTGVNELYHFNPSTGSFRQKTSTRYGAADFTYSPDGNMLYYSSQTLMGKQIFRTPVDSLFNRTVKFDSLYKYHIAERIKEQETDAAKKQGFDKAVTVKDEDVRISEPKRYRKIPHMFNLHTWFPAYVSVDNIMNNLSFDPLWQVLSLGVSGVMQNHLATAVGEVGYSAHKDPYNKSKWRHSGHFKFTYSGLYPIFQFSFDINDRGARQYANYAECQSGSIFMVSSKELKTPYIQGKASMYIPFNFSSGGWNKGVIPNLSYTITNDIFDNGTIMVDVAGNNGFSMGFAGYKDGHKGISQYIGGSVRAYAMRSIANSQVYPRWGIGAEAGVSSGLESYRVFSPMGYLYGYGYLPGIMRTQGIKITGMWQRKLRDESPFSQNIVSILPRGLSDNSSLASHLSLYHKDLIKLTADYAIPIYIGDVTIGGNWLAIKRLVAYPHFDYTFVNKTGLWSAGLDLTADLHAIITLEWPCSVGVSFSWNGGSAWNTLSENIEMNKWFIGPVFNVSF